MCWLKRGVPLPLGAIHNQRSLVALDNLVDLIVTCLHHPAAANQTLRKVSHFILARGPAPLTFIPYRLPFCHPSGVKCHDDERGCYERNFTFSNQ